MPDVKCKCGHPLWMHTKRCRATKDCKCKLSWQEVAKSKLL